MQTLCYDGEHPPADAAQPAGVDDGHPEAGHSQSGHIESHKLFETFDKDSDGCITKWEMHDVLLNLGHDHLVEEISELMGEEDLIDCDKFEAKIRLHKHFDQIVAAIKEQEKKVPIHLAVRLRAINSINVKDGTCEIAARYFAFFCDKNLSSQISKAAKKKPFEGDDRAFVEDRVSQKDGTLTDEMKALCPTIEIEGKKIADDDELELAVKNDVKLAKWRIQMDPSQTSLTRLEAELNWPGEWDFFVSHTQQNTAATTLAEKLCVARQEHPHVVLAKDLLKRTRAGIIRSHN